MTDINFPGSVSLLAAMLFVVTELFLLPLFEQARERLTAAYLRHRIANGDSVWVGCENKLFQWFGLSDGVYMAGRGLALPRFFKTFLKLALLVSCFIFYFNIESAKVATKVTYSFNGGGAYVVAPIPVNGLSNHEAVLNEESGKIKNLRHDLKLQLDIDFHSWCTSIERSQSSTERFVYFGIFNLIDGSFVCLNGTEGRDRGIAFSYNPHKVQKIRSNISSMTLIKTNTTSSIRGMYNVEVIMEDTTDVHRGYIYIRNFGNSLVWDFYGLFIHSKRETILQLSIVAVSRQGMLCNQTSADSPSNDNWLGTWRRISDTFICPNRSFELAETLSIEPDVQDVNFRLGSRDEFVLGTPHELIRTWVYRTSTVDLVNMFANEVTRTISKPGLFFSGAKNDTIELQTGPTVEHAKIARFPTIALCVSVVALVMYCVVSFIVDLRSKNVTGVSSNILSRDASIRMLHDEAVEKDLVLESKKFRFPVGLTSNLKCRVRSGVDRRKMTKTSI